MLAGLFKDPGNRLDLGVIWSNSRSHQAVRCREAFDHVDRDSGFKKGLGGVKTRRSGADNGYALLRHDW